jgi:type VI secretion system VgrG family protein
MRNVELSLESGDPLDVRHYNVLESLSAAFRIDVVARPTDDSIDLRKIAGRGATFKIHTGHGVRTWTGVVADIAQTEVETEGLSTYSVQVAPKLWLLDHRKGHRVFQHASVPDIARKLLGEWDIPVSVKLVHKYPKLPMRVQYGESDYDFFRRLLAEAGISFFFHTEGREETRLVLSDAPHLAEPAHGAALPFTRDDSLAGSRPHISNVHISHKVVPAKTTFRDYDFRRPRYPLGASHTAEGGAHPLLEDYHFAHGHTLHEAAAGEDAAGDGEGAYRHHEEEAKSRAERRAEAHAGAGLQIAFETNAQDLHAGVTFRLKGHPHREVDRKLLVLHSWINGDVSDSFHAGGKAVPADKPYRPRVEHAAHYDPYHDGGDAFQPLKRLQKPRIVGLQSAIVTGPPGEDIHTDEHGRVKVQFPWDREGKFDDKSSPWVRVSQAWAGAGFGHMTIPRVGQEVLIGFHDGDPDHPVIVGSMHNSTAPVPYGLPEHKTRTSWKSNGHEGSNEITFDDKREEELFYIQAERDLHKIVKKDELEHTQGNRHVHVDGDLVLSARGRVVIHAGDDLVIKGGPNVKINPGDKPKEGKRPRALAARAKSDKKDGHKSHADDNDRLKHMSPGSLPASRAHAAAQKKVAEKYKDLAIKLGKKHGVPPALILGLMSRESDFGAALDSHGRGDGGRGYGILQVDVGTIKHPRGGPTSYEHLDQAMGVFDDKLASVKAAHPGWTRDQQLAGAVAAYNAGAGNIQTQPSNAAGWAAMDQGTTGDDYSRDTWARSQWFANHLDW